MKRLSGLVVGMLLLAAGRAAHGQKLMEPKKTLAKPALQVPYQVQTPLRPPESKKKPTAQRTTKTRYTQYSEDKTLTWDATFKEIYPEPGLEKGELFFHVSNDSERPVTITQIRPSCGCTLAKSPDLPWTLNPKDGDQINLSINLKGKRGTLTKSVSVYSSAGRKHLTFKVHLYDPKKAVAKMTMSERLKNMQIAAKDRQAVFKGNCKSCHYDATLGKRGEDLFVAACGICHETPHRATMVPDLSVAKAEIKRNEAYWTLWITHGKAGTLMPAFHKGQGGPLTNEQIKDLASYMVERFPDDPPAVNASEKAVSANLNP
ncbi:MAG: Cytochrome c6 [Verrucomicrobia subdivision 3 bacterium]|nr:Cytochrome c6 [Limisphaerales bacterium]MCS1416024.1 Cytochrome c6 [Limisphaerales bacterium]